MQSFETVEDSDDESRSHDQTRGEGVGFFEYGLPLDQVVRRHTTTDGCDHEAEQSEAGDGQRRYVDRAVLP